MEKSHKDILTRLRKNIIDDLDVDNDIILPLRKEYNILSDDDIKDIYIGTTKEERAGNLLDILPRYVCMYIHIHTYIYIYTFFTHTYTHIHIRAYIMQSYMFYFNVIALTNDTSNYISQVI